jgi:glutamine synthetase
VARSIGCVATFMPKPWSDGFGSGAHMNLSLADLTTGRNTFAAGDGLAPRGDHGYTDLAYHFTAGVLRHAEAITAVVCPTVNSYKRLFPYGRMREMSWAPVYQAYGHNNRTLICRLPMNRHCLELRHVDSACNLYLGTALSLAAGLEGIAEKLDPGAPIEFDTYTVAESELAKMGAPRLPRTLADALDALEGDALAKEVLGAEFHATFLEYKRAEWEDYCMAVGEWEREKYLRLW